MGVDNSDWWFWSKIGFAVDAGVDVWRYEDGGWRLYRGVKHG